MKKQLHKCTGTNPDNTKYTQCGKFFFGPVCPACSGKKYHTIEDVDIPEIRKAHSVLEKVITGMNTHLNEKELLDERVGVKVAIRILEAS